MMVQLYLHCQKDLLCHHLCLQRTSLENELQYSMPAEFDESSVVQSKVLWIAQLDPFRTLKIGLIGMGTYIIHMTAKMIAWWRLNLI